MTIDTILATLCQTFAREIGEQLRSPDFVRTLSHEIVREMNGQPSTPRKDTFSVEELAEMTQQNGVKSYSPYTIRKACRQGRIKAASHNKRWLISQAEIERVLNGGLPAESGE